MLPVVYSLSTNSYRKERLSKATKEACLNNSIRVFGEQNIHLLVDDTNLDLNIRGLVNKLSELANLEFYSGGSSSASWKKAFEYIISNINGPFLRQEDDYINRLDTDKILLEGLEKLHYCTGYAHGDRFIPKEEGGSQFSNGGYFTYLFKTKSVFWSLVESTTLTFASTTNQLKDDIETWNKWTFNNSHPNDFMAFYELTKEKNRYLGSCIPSYSTHSEERWLAPTIGINVNDWENIL